MKLEWKEIRNNLKTKEEYFDFIGAIHGYSKESRDFFSKYIPHMGFRQAMSPQTLKDFNNSGFSGTGYISNPKELKDLRLGKTTKEEIIRGIDSRRALKVGFVKSNKDMSLARAMYEKLMWLKRGRVPRPLDFDENKLEPKYKKIALEIYSKVK